MAEHALGPALLYDDGCRFCRACAALVARWDRGGRVDLLPRSAAASVELLRTLDPALRDGSMHLIDREGRPLRPARESLLLCHRDGVRGLRDDYG